MGLSLPVQGKGLEAPSKAWCTGCTSWPLFTLEASRQADPEWPEIRPQGSSAACWASRMQAGVPSGSLGPQTESSRLSQPKVFAFEVPHRCWATWQFR